MALFAGFVPLHECHATGTFEGGAVLVGTHAHHGHDRCGRDADGSPVDRDATGTDRDDDGGHDACCVDTPFLGSLPSAPVAFVPAWTATCPVLARFALPVAGPAPAAFDVAAGLAIPRGTRTTVLLR